MATAYADVTVPALREGNWKIAVDVNPNRDIFEGVNVANNWLEGGSISVHVQEIPFQANLTLKKNDVVTYRMEVAAGETFWLAADSTDVTLKIRENFVPTATLYDGISEVCGDQRALRIEAASEDRVFYVTLSAGADITGFSLKKLSDETVIPGDEIIEVDWNAAGKFSYKLDIPNAVRAGRFYKGTVTVTNTRKSNDVKAMWR